MRSETNTVSPVNDAVETVSTRWFGHLEIP